MLQKLDARVSHLEELRKLNTPAPTVTGVNADQSTRDAIDFANDPNNAAIPKRVADIEWMLDAMQVDLQGMLINYNTIKGRVGEIDEKMAEAGLDDSAGKPAAATAVQVQVPKVPVVKEAPQRLRRPPPAASLQLRPPPPSAHAMQPGAGAANPVKPQPFHMPGQPPVPPQHMAPATLGGHAGRGACGRAPRPACGAGLLDAPDAHPRPRRRGAHRRREPRRARRRGRAQRRRERRERRARPLHDGRAAQAHQGRDALRL